MKYILTYFFITTILFLSLSAQTNGVKIEGIVNDNLTNEVLVGVNIILYQQNNNSEYTYLSGTTTNSNGLFSSQRLAIGKYKLSFKSIGYKEKIEIIEVQRNNGIINLNVSMESEAVELNEVLVREEKLKEKNVSVINVSTKLLSLLPSISGEADIFRSLQMLPGVKVASEMSNGVYIRGGSPDQNLTLVDGAMIYNPAHLGNIASTFNSHAIHDMKLIKGAFPAEYGGRLSSVLDIKLREGSKDKEKVIFGLGTINSHVVIEGPISEKFTYILSGRVMYYDRIQSMFQKKSVTPKFNFYDTNLKLNYQISSKENISISGLYSKDYIYSPELNLGFKYNIGWSNSNINLNWIKEISNRVITNTNISLIGYDFSSSLDDLSSDSVASDYFSSSELMDFSLKEKLEYKFTTNSKVVSGLEFILHNYELVNWIYYNPILETSPDHSEKFNSSELAVFVQHEWDPYDFLGTNLGLRAIKYSLSNEVKIEPRLSLSLSLTENLIFKSAYAIAHQYLHLILRNDIRLPTDLWYPSSSKITPAKSSQYVAGFDFYFDNKNYLFALEGYYKDYNNLYEIQDLPEYSIDRRIEDNFTRGKGEAYGVELFLNKRSENFIGWIGYTYSFTKRLFENLNTGNIFKPRYDRRHDISVVGTYSFNENFSVGFTWTFSSGPGLTMPVSKYYFSNEELNEPEKVQIYYSDRNEYKLNDYHKMDVNLKYATKLFDLNFDFYVSLINVYNQKNAFTQYIAHDYNEETNSYDYDSGLKLRQITLMPFFPTFGFTVTI